MLTKFVGHPVAHLEDFFSDVYKNIFRVRLMLGNIEELRDYHKHVMLPKMETAVDNAAIMRYPLGIHTKHIYTPHLVSNMSLRYKTNSKELNVTFYASLDLYKN